MQDCSISIANALELLQSYRGHWFLCSIISTAETFLINPSAPGTWSGHDEYVIFKQISLIDILNVSNELAVDSSGKL